MAGTRRAGTRCGPLVENRSAGGGGSRPPVLSPLGVLPILPGALGRESESSRAGKGDWGTRLPSDDGGGGVGGLRGGVLDRIDTLSMSTSICSSRMPVLLDAPWFWYTDTRVG